MLTQTTACKVNEVVEVCSRRSDATHMLISRVFSQICSFTGLFPESCVNPFEFYKLKEDTGTQPGDILSEKER